MLIEQLIEEISSDQLFWIGYNNTLIVVRFISYIITYGKYNGSGNLHTHKNVTCKNKLILHRRHKYS